MLETIGMTFILIVSWACFFKATWRSTIDKQERIVLLLQAMFYLLSIIVIKV